MPLAYGVILALTGIADGLWQGAYAWFLSAKLGFTAPEIAVVIGSQFILQIVLEVPSGTSADRGNTRRILVLSYAAFALYCAIYAIAGYTVTGELGQISKPLLLGLAVIAEALFGVGTAFLSGTLDAWVAERERAASREHADDFARRLRKIHSISELWGQAPSALVGTAAFLFATQGHAEWPWILGGLLYLAAGGVIFAAIPSAPPSGDATTSPTLAESVGRFTSRALSYLQERPETLRLFLRDALAYMPFYATQVFWIPFLAQTLFVGHADILDTGSTLVGAIPLLATMWGAGELARALGGSLFAGRSSRTLDREDRSRRLVHVSIGMFGYSAGVALQLAAVLIDWNEVQIFAIGYLLSRFCEGRVRRDLSIATDQSIISDRATLRSLGALIKALIGLVYITLVGALIHADPIIGYLTIGATAVLAAIQLVMLARERRTEELPGSIRTRWHRGNWLTIGFVVGALGVLILVGTQSRPLWARLNMWSSAGDVVHMKQAELRATKTGSNVSELGTWELWSEGQHAIGCRVPIEGPKELWNNDLAVHDLASTGDVRARLRSIGGEYYLEFRLLSKPNILTVKLSERASRHVQCFRLLPSPPTRIVFDERGVVPVSAAKMSSPTSSSLIVYVELVIGIFVVIVLIGLAGADVRRRLQEVLQTVPGTLLDQARESTGTRPDLIREPSEGLPTAGFLPFERFLSNLGASCLVLGGYSSDGKTLSEIWIHEYGLLWKLDRTADHAPAMRSRVGDLNALLPEWLDLVATRENKADEYSRTLARRDPTQGGEPGQLGPYAAGSVVLRRVARSDAGRRGKIGGFAVAIFARDGAPRYISPMERKVLQLLAELSRMQLERAHRNVDVHDTLHWAKTILDTIRLPLSEAARTSQWDRALIAGCASRAALGHARLSEKLGVDTAVNPPVEPRAKLFEVASLFTLSADGKMKVSLDMERLERPIRHHAWVLIEGALIELLWNAAKYGCDPDHPDVIAVVCTRRGKDDAYVFTVENDRPLDPGGATRARGIGLVTTPRRVAECGGEFFPLAGVDGRTVVGFSLPRAFVEDAYETGPYPRRR